MALNKKTLVVGASENPQRYSNIATRQLRSHGHEVLAFGLKEGVIGDVTISKELPHVNDIDTVTLYVGPAAQKDLIQPIIDLHPGRVIFNPGTENEAFYKALSDAGIPFTEACTLVLLSVGDY